jgi:hypothetical protein
MLARVVGFDGVSKERIAQLKQNIESQEQPEDIPATEMILLHDAPGERSLAIMFFDSEEDYARADAALNAMPRDDTPGSRTGVTKYDVAMRMSSQRA